MNSFLFFLGVKAELKEILTLCQPKKKQLLLRDFALIELLIKGVAPFYQFLKLRGIHLWSRIGLRAEIIEFYLPILLCRRHMDIADINKDRGKKKDEKNPS